MTAITIDRATVEQALEALRELLPDERDPNCGGYDARDVRQWRATAGALRAALAEPVPHGCHVDLDDDMEPDGCVLDEGSPHTCVYADRLLREGKNKTACNYWKPIEVKK